MSRPNWAYNAHMASQAQIRVLSSQVANKIAAGEVVERPASVLKELLENAVDAGATRIDVEIINGGRKLVAVSDNGRGMKRDDAILSIERHATSKIRDVDDIERVSTLGFRGEALAAISSVCRFILKTCAKGDDMGTEVLVTGGKVRDVRETGCPAGCTIEVRDLFFNVPARRKFLRSEKTELSHIKDTFIRLALARADISMTMKIDGRDAFTLAASDDCRDRLRDLYGAAYCNRLCPVEGVVGKARISGWVSVPGMSRSDRSEQFFFVNGRAAGAPVLGYCLKEAYRTLLPGNRHSSVFLFVELDPGQVDINVHPTKKEVRFRRPSEVRDMVINNIRQALSGDRPGKAEPVENEISELVGQQIKLEIDNLPRARIFKYPRLPMTPEPLAEKSQKEGAGISGSSSTMERQPAGNVPWSWCRVLGQVGDLYVLLEMEDGYAVMDPHAAHERVLFERFMAQILASEVDIQSLLMPETVELGPGDAERVRSNLDLFKSMGFGVSEFGLDTFMVDALPACLAGISPKALLIDVSADLERAGKHGGRERWCEESIAQSACKAAAKARDRLSLEEIERIVVDLAAAEMPYTCPHGRPTIIFTPFRELHKKFARE